MNKTRHSKFAVFFDFDNTITSSDILDDIIEKFSVDNEWKKHELLWKQGKIGSKECLKRQLASVRITKARLCKYLSTVKLDSGFRKLLTFLKKKGVHPVILSDNFSFIIKYILRKNRVTGLKVYSNEIRFHKDKLLPSFPHGNTTCLRCGHCKKNSLFRDKFRDKIIYIGDGLSDTCPAEEADLVFAKGSLRRHFKKIGKDCIEMQGLKDVFNHLKGAL